MPGEDPAHPRYASAAFVMEKWQWGLEPRPRLLKANLVAFAILLLWAGLMWVTPYMNEPGTLMGLDGYVGVKDSPVDFSDLDPVSRFMYEAGDSQCHQRQNRTIILNGNEMPFCARDVAIYTFMAVGVLLTVFPTMPLYDRLNDLKWYWLVLALVPIGIDGTGQLLGYWESTNPMRVLTGGLCGLVVGIALGFMIREMGGMVGDWQREREINRRMEREPPRQEGG